MAEPLNLTGFVGLDPNLPEICTIEASCVTGFEPMAQEEIQASILDKALTVNPIGSFLSNLKKIYIKKFVKKNTCYFLKRIIYFFLFSNHQVF